MEKQAAEMESKVSSARAKARGGKGGEVSVQGQRRTLENRLETVRLSITR